MCVFMYQRELTSESACIRESVLQGELNWCRLGPGPAQVEIFQALSGNDQARAAIFGPCRALISVVQIIMFSGGR